MAISFPFTERLLPRSGARTNSRLQEGPGKVPLCLPVLGRQDVKVVRQGRILMHRMFGAEIVAKIWQAV